MALTPRKRLRNETRTWGTQLAHFIIPVLSGALVYANYGWRGLGWDICLYAALEFIYLSWVAHRQVRRLGAKLAEANQRDNGE